MTEEETEEIPDGDLSPRRWSWLYLAGVIVGTVGNLGKVLVVACDEVQSSIAQHVMWVDERKDFADSVRSDLETLPVSDSVKTTEGAV